MCPESYDAPTPFAKQAGYLMIALPVALHLGIPIFAVGVRTAVAPRAAMPEAAVYEHGSPLTPENEVWFSGEGCIAPPSGDFGAAKQSRESNLGFLVAARTDQGHDV
jgi:hypothetical protein